MNFKKARLFLSPRTDPLKSMQCLFFQIKRFAGENEETLSSAQREVKQAIETTEANVKWMEKNYETIAAWLKNQQNK